MKVVGHRGARGVFPENTIEGFEYALGLEASGIDAVELDLAVTRDDEVVVVHDLVLNRDLYLRDGKRFEEEVPIRSLNLTDLENYEVGRLKNSAFPKQVLTSGAKVPTLDAFLSLVNRMKAPQSRDIQIYLELKSLPGCPDLTPEPSDFANLVVDRVREHGLNENVMILSFDGRLLKAVQEQSSSLKTCLNIGGCFFNFLSVAKELNLSALAPQLNWVDRSSVEDLHSAGIEVISWTANEEHEWEKLVKTGVDGIVSDYPEALLNYLKGKGVR